MTEEQLYENVVLSLVKWVEDFRKTNYGEAKYVDWDAHASISELPTVDVVMGPAGCGMTEESPGEYEVVFSFGVGTYQDENLFTLRKVISQLFGKLTIGMKIPIYDASTAEPVSWMTIASPRSVTPVTRAEVRSLQFVNLTGRLDPGATSSLR
jgi:hypothetical protein